MSGNYLNDSDLSARMGGKARDLPLRASDRQEWASEILESNHTEALWTFGELVVLTMMWKPSDHIAGRVEKCEVCRLDDEVTEAFQQAENRKCPNCFGTTFDKGIRAQVVRPAIFSDNNTDTVDAAQGELTIETLMVETVGDVTFRRGDYIFRTNNVRYQGDEVTSAVLRTGFDIPAANDSFKGTIPQAHREDPTSVAYMIPPDSEALRYMKPIVLDDSGVPLDLTRVDYIAPYGYL